jgi:hypothetical protein
MSMYLLYTLMTIPPLYSHFIFGIYNWAFLYSLNYKSVFPPPQALMSMLKVVRLINLYTIPQKWTTPFTKLLQGSWCRIYHEWAHNMPQLHTNVRKWRSCLRVTMITGLNQGGQLFRTLFRHIWSQTILYALPNTHQLEIEERYTSSQNLITHHPKALDINFEMILQG